MVSKLVKRSGLVAALGLFLANPSDLTSCGPFVPSAIFTRTTGPDDEQEFYRGRLGILQPHYERRYLAVAYRLLRFDWRGSSPDVDQAVKDWLAARAAIPGTAAVQIDPYRQSGSFANS